MTAGPIERRRTSRLYFRVFGHWPRAVVEERLSRPWMPSESFKAMFREIYENAGMPVPSEYAASHATPREGGERV